MLRESQEAHEPLSPRALSRLVLALIALGTLLRVLLAAFVTDGVLVDDAYITLRYARHGAEQGALVYNVGESVFGVTSPLWAFVTTGLHFVFGRAFVGAAVLAFGIAAWAVAGALACRTANTERARAAIAAVFVFAPVFVDNQMLGMETPLFVLLALGAMGAAHAGRWTAAAAWTGLLMVARPEGVLFAPALVWLGAVRTGGLKPLVAKLAVPARSALILGPGMLWVSFALYRYGTVLPSSMVAKSGWNSTHYDALQSLENAWYGLARLTFVPFVDYLAPAAAHALTAAVVGVVLWVLQSNVRRGTEQSRAWLGVYALYIAFYLAGKGATEASWYAVPSSVALLLAAAPAFDLVRARWAPVAAATLCAALSIAFVTRRAPLLQSYVDGYGQCADALERTPGTEEARVLIGEIGVFGFRSTRHVIDVGALVSPEVLALKNEGLSLVQLMRRTDADWLVISDIALETNVYPSVGEVWANDAERDWLRRAELVEHALDKRLYKLPSDRSEVAAANDG